MPQLVDIACAAALGRVNRQRSDIGAVAAKGWSWSAMHEATYAGQDGGGGVRGGSQAHNAHLIGGGGGVQWSVRRRQRPRRQPAPQQPVGRQWCAPRNAYLLRKSG
jgi:hypothetical protein